MTAASVYTSEKRVWITTFCLSCSEGKRIQEMNIDSIDRLESVIEILKKAKELLTPQRPSWRSWEELTQCERDEIIGQRISNEAKFDRDSIRDKQSNELCWRLLESGYWQASDIPF
jgi:hypothetical protein